MLRRVATDQGKLPGLLDGPLAWRHVTLTIHLAWRPGDPRGFRNHAHRIHSSGDYRSPPPPGEHAGLLRHSFRLNPRPPRPLDAVAVRYQVLHALLTKLEGVGVEVAAIAVCPTHAHVDARLPRDLPAAKAVVGAAKQRASHRVRSLHPGTLWARGGSYKLVKDLAHQRAALNYIAFKQEAGSVVWTFKHGYFVRVGAGRRRCLTPDEMGPD